MTNKNIFLKDHGIFLERATAKLSSIYTKEERITERFERTRKITKKNGKETLITLTSCFGVTKTIKTYFFNYKDKNFEGNVHNTNLDEIAKVWEALAVELEKEIDNSSKCSSVIGQIACVSDGTVTANNEIPKEWFPIAPVENKNKSIKKKAISVKKKK